tara:strand:+ start:2629 stop:2901 length:273 start_codon:yes stop_codon:yes gene_type:complete
MAISKLIHEVKKFSLGIIARPDDERDTPDDAAVLSLNIESLADGELRGIPQDLYLKQSGFDSNYSSILYEQGGGGFIEPDYQPVPSLPTQ